LANGSIFAMLAELFGGRENGLFGGVAMPLLRFIAVALVAVSMAVWFGVAAVAEPLDRDSCLKLQGDRQKLLTRDMQAALDRGPDWVKDHLNSDEIEKVRQFLDVEAMIEFRCRNGGVVKRSETAATSDSDVPPLPDRKPAPPASDVAAGDSGTPLPERKPGSSPPASADVSASQTVADSDKTAPPKTKATR
jgi:hypothetical protein